MDCMQHIHTVAVLGAGAMGAVLATHFLDAPGFSTVFVAEGERLERLRKQGVVVNGRQYFVPVQHPAEASAPVDLILVALKHHQLKDAISQLNKLVGDETVFLSVMNGLESEEIIGALYGMQKVLYAISLEVDAVRVGNQVTYTKAGRTFFGDARNPSHSQKVLRVKEAFERAGLRYEIPEDMLRMMWWKFMFNVGINQASAVLRAPYGVFQSNADAQNLMEALMQEVYALAQALEINITQQDIQNWYPVLNRLSPQGKTSMLQDIEARRRTEVDVFAGKVIELGKKTGVATPVNQTVYQIIRVLEETASVSLK
jgi:2-dehydropantoate 2-reductase